MIHESSKIKFTVDTSVYIGSGYSDWKQEFYADHVIDIPKLKDFIRSYCKHKLVISVIQQDFSELILFEHELTYSYLDKLSMCKDAFSLIGIEIKTEE